MNKFTPADQKKIELIMELRAKLWERNLKQTIVAKKIKKSKALVCQVLNAKTTSKPTVDAIFSLIKKGGIKFFIRTFGLYNIRIPARYGINGRLF